MAACASAWEQINGYLIWSARDIVNGIGKSHWSLTSLGRVFRQSLGTVPDYLNFTVAGLTPRPHTSLLIICAVSSSTKSACRCELADLFSRLECQRAGAVQVIFTRSIIASWQCRQSRPRLCDEAIALCVQF